MKKILALSALSVITLTGILRSFAGDPKTAVAVQPPKDMKAEARKNDSIAYFNVEVESNLHAYQGDTNEILLYNGIKLHFNKITRLSLPRGAGFTLPDSSYQRFQYDLLELEISGTNTTAADVKLDGSEPVFVSLKLFCPDNYKGYPSQYVLSFGSYYLKTEPQQTEKMNSVYIASHEFLDKTYKPGQTKTFSGIIVAVPKSIKRFDKLVIYNREFGQNRSYGCPIRL